MVNQQICIIGAVRTFILIIIYHSNIFLNAQNVFRINLFWNAEIILTSFHTFQNNLPLYEDCWWIFKTATDVLTSETNAAIANMNTQLWIKKKQIWKPSKSHFYLEQLYSTVANYS